MTTKCYKVFYFDNNGNSRNQYVDAKRRDSAWKMVKKMDKSATTLEAVYEVEYNATSELIADNID